MQTPYSSPYRDLNIIQKSLFKRIVDPETGDKDASLLARVWVEVEAFKREMRGIPRLLGHTLEEVAKGRIATAKRLSPSNALPPYDELDDAPTPAPVPSTPPDTTV